jgi:hypothetical protein
MVKTDTIALPLLQGDPSRLLEARLKPCPTCQVILCICINYGLVCYSCFDKLSTNGVSIGYTVHPEPVEG